MTASTEPEVDNVLQRHKRMAESRPQSRCAKIGEVRPRGFRDMRADSHTDRQTHKHAQHNTSHRSQERSNSL